MVLKKKPYFAKMRWKCCFVFTGHVMYTRTIFEQKQQRNAATCQDLRAAMSARGFQEPLQTLEMLEKSQTEVTNGEK